MTIEVFLASRKGVRGLKPLNMVNSSRKARERELGSILLSIHYHPGFIQAMELTSEDMSEVDREKDLDAIVDKLQFSPEHEAIAQEIGGALEMLPFAPYRPMPAKI